MEETAIYQDYLYKLKKEGLLMPKFFMRFVAKYLENQYTNIERNIHFTNSLSFLVVIMSSIIWIVVGFDLPYDNLIAFILLLIQLVMFVFYLMFGKITTYYRNPDKNKNSREFSKIRREIYLKKHKY